MNQMAMCQDCGNDEADGALCEPCRLDRVLNDMMKLSTHQLAQVAREAMAYPGVAVHMASKGDLVRIMGEAAVHGD